ncbi:hypothetical protein PR048_012309 [Dryococelus australis]|uniref:DDE-1 domain-containing protein n=1 Tax=Dryococelus australis TaxID=614101 RepID=A0ABQ9HP89_9NEOP|nr:hypothetical protein PR048_012309 [Dryococelus australis]
MPQVVKKEHLSQPLHYKCLWSSIATAHGVSMGTLVLAAQSGWTNSELFARVMKHFVKVYHLSKENLSYLTLDNNERHLSITALDIAKDNCVTVLTIPPHCSNCMHPLDTNVFR